MIIFEPRHGGTGTLGDHLVLVLLHRIEELLRRDGSGDDDAEVLRAIIVAMVLADCAELTEWPQSKRQHTGLDGEGTKIGHHAAGLCTITAASRIHQAVHRVVQAVLAVRLATLHLRIDDAGVLALAVDVVHLRVARLAR